MSDPTLEELGLIALLADLNEEDVRRQYQVMTEAYAAVSQLVAHISRDPNADR